jgi:hypothetical protein
MSHIFKDMGHLWNIYGANTEEHFFVNMLVR